MTPEFERFELAARIRRMLPRSVMSVAEEIVSRLPSPADPEALATSIKAWADSLAPVDLKKDD